MHHTEHGRSRRLLRRGTSALAAATLGATCAVLALGDHTSPGTGAPATAALEIRSVAYQQAVVRAADPSTRSKVTVVATGGTLAGKATGRTTYGSYRAGTYPITDMLDVLRPELDSVADVDSVQFGNGGSGSYTIEKYRELTLAVEQALETADSVVVTTGTDTMEEFAWWLDLTVQSRKPVVITGAMRPWAAGDTAGDRGVLGTDGPANLYNAVKLAASNKTTCFGTVLMLNDEFHTAREVRKASTTRMDTFETPHHGPLGYIDDSVTVRRAPARAAACGTEAWHTPFDMDTIKAADLPVVEIAYAYQQASGAGITAAVAAGARGIVTMGTGAGGLSGTMGAARTAAIGNGVWFVSTSRTGTGSVTSSGNGIIAGGDLQGPKARLLLLLARAATTDLDQARTWFRTIGNPDASVPAPDTEPTEPTPEPTPTPTPTTGATPATGATATSTTLAPVGKVRRGKRSTWRIWVGGVLAPTGTVTLSVNGKVVKEVPLSAASNGVLTTKVAKRRKTGRIGVQASFTPSATTTATVQPSTAITWVKVVR